MEHAEGRARRRSGAAPGTGCRYSQGEAISTFATAATRSARPRAGRSGESALCRHLGGRARAGTEGPCGIRVRQRRALDRPGRNRGCAGPERELSTGSGSMPTGGPNPHRPGGGSQPTTTSSTPSSPAPPVSEPERFRQPRPHARPVWVDGLITTERVPPTAGCSLLFVNLSPSAPARLRRSSPDRANTQTRHAASWSLLRSSTSRRTTPRKRNACIPAPNAPKRGSSLSSPVHLPSVSWMRFKREAWCSRWRYRPGPETARTHR
jgi:hypothetical protein